jgi:hypothetical protein
MFAGDGRQQKTPSERRGLGSVMREDVIARDRKAPGKGLFSTARQCTNSTSSVNDVARCRCCQCNPELARRRHCAQKKPGSKEPGLRQWPREADTITFQEG